MDELNNLGGLGEFGNLAPPPEPESRDDLGQEDFLTLMITQFQNQDPFEPMDNGDFLGQLAQFGTVNGIDQLNSSFTSLQNSIQSEQALQATSLVGHTVLAESDITYLPEDGRVAGAVELQASASDVEVEITDINGQLVRRLNLGAQSPGLTRFAWDGSDLSGDRVPAGHFKVQTRVIQGGFVESAETLLEANIDSVSLGGPGEALTLNILGGDTLSLDQVRRIL